LKLVKTIYSEDKIEEPLIEVVDESDDLDVLKQKGLEIAAEDGNPDAIWIPGVIPHSKPVSSEGRWTLEISPNYFLGIE
jgi:hypothetical protein